MAMPKTQKQRILETITLLLALPTVTTTKPVSLKLSKTTKKATYDGLTATTYMDIYADSNT